MRVILIRVGVLGTLLVLGWITIAHAQRGGEVAEGNPLRAEEAVTQGQSPTPLRTAPVAKPKPTDSRLLSDPFGPRTRAPIAPASNNEPVSPRPQAPAENGPALLPVNPARSAPMTNRYSSEPDGAPAPPIERQDDIPPAGVAGLESPPAGREPPPLRDDLPANPMPLGRSEPPHTGTAARDGNNFSGNNSLAGSSLESEGGGRPGAAHLEGVQSPQLMIQKTAPKEVQVGRPAVFRVTVRNTGSAPACQVEIHDQVPRGARLVDTTPKARRGVNGELIWTLGTIPPGQESFVEMQIMPTAEGEIGSVATVHFGADASARTIATRPQLVLETALPETVLIGDQVVLGIVISNHGTGVAAGVVLEERIPPGLAHPAGKELEYAVGDLKPGESRRLELPLVADQAGKAVNLLVARGEGNLRVEDKRAVDVLAPKLDVALEGPKRRFLERQATYQLLVHNPGTASARKVELAAYLPEGLKFVSANNSGYYDETTRTVRWQLEELPAQETGSVELVTMPVEAGQHAIKLRGSAQKGLLVEKEQPVLVEGLAAILFQVADSADPVEVGRETTYEIRVVNQGSKAASNVRLSVLLPADLEPLAAEGPTRFAREGNNVVFDGLASLAPKAETVYRVRVRAVRAGDLRARFQLQTDDMQTPVMKEESTRAYADE
jgi:uncharacterized repeat protein (TIGR01451 family)